MDNEMNSKQREYLIERQEASHQYFENRECKYYPCHNMGISGFNCLFCYCPMYFAICPGTPEYIEIRGTTVKSCFDCEYPHRPENYQAIIEYIASMLKEGG